MKRLVICTVSTVGLMVASPTCRAKISDCLPIASSGTEYSSHGNYVQAVKQSTGEVLWKTILFTETYTREFDPKLEEDVQLNIACIREVRATEIVVSDHRERIFRVSRANGKLIATGNASK